jgi:hypothetical protein
VSRLWVKYVSTEPSGEVGPGHPCVRVRASRPSWLTRVNAGFVGWVNVVHVYVQ